jgi:pyrroloquinoline quinone (PQQ) biosynthesis protein C
MTSLLDSTAHFTERCLKLGLGQQFVTALNRAGVDNLSRLAFAVGQPEQAIQNNEVEDFLQHALGRASTLVEASSIKRMAFEAHTYLAATLQHQVDHTDDAQPRKVAYLRELRGWNS